MDVKPCSVRVFPWSQEKTRQLTSWISEKNAHLVQKLSSAHSSFSQILSKIQNAAQNALSILAASLAYTKSAVTKLIDKIHLRKETPSVSSSLHTNIHRT